MNREKSAERVDLSVVIPSYNSAPWLPSTLDALATCLSRIPKLRAEVIVVDDGSSDDTPEVLGAIRATYPCALHTLRQENSGRFVSRWVGANAAKAPTIVLLDSRVLIDENALAFHFGEANGVAARNAHIVPDPQTPLVGLFWEVPTRLFWGRYLADPRPTTITLENFDRVPKGTTCFLVPTGLFKKSCVATWPVGDPRLTSDDTRLLRHIAGEVPIELDPRFAATYRARTTLRSFLGHSFSRGTLFVDSYWGTNAKRSVALIALCVAPPIVLGSLTAFAVIGYWRTFVGVAATGLIALLAPAVIAASRRCRAQAIAAYLALILPFGAVFWAGLVRGLVNRRRGTTAHLAGPDAAQ